MKSHCLAILTAAIVSAGALPLVAQVTTETTKTTTTTGAITTLQPDVISVRTESSTSPLSYTYSKTTKFVDSAGAPVSMEIVKSGAPVVVHYIKEGDRMIAQKVVVQKTTTSPGAVTETKKTTTTTEPGATTTQVKTITSTGTVSALDTQAIALRTETSTSPVRYTFTKSTQYVDEDGNPVSVNVVKSGAPVTVHYITEGDQQVAQKVVVKKTTTVR